MIRRGFMMPVLFIAGAAVLGCATMLLWNALMPAIFGLPALSFLQALGLLLLSRVLIGFGFCRMGHGFHSRMHDKWHRMSPQEKFEFISKRHMMCRDRVRPRPHQDPDEE